MDAKFPNMTGYHDMASVEKESGEDYLDGPWDECRTSARKERIN